MKRSVAFALAVCAVIALAGMPSLGLAQRQPFIELFDGYLIESARPDDTGADPDCPPKDRGYRFTIRAKSFAALAGLYKSPVVERTWYESAPAQWGHDWLRGIKQGTRMAYIRCQFDQDDESYDYEFYFQERGRDIVAVWDRGNQRWVNFAGQSLQPTKPAPGTRFFLAE